MSNLNIPADEWLKEQFEYELCPECGGDAENHEAEPFLGNWFARCKNPPMRQASFITDIGESLTVTTDNGRGQSISSSLGRYGAWVEEGGKLRVIETSDDLDYLRRRHGDVPLREIKRS